MIGLSLGVTRATGKASGSPPPTPVVTDTFDRADSAVSLGTATSGHVWTPRHGTWGISGNKGYCPTPAVPSEATLNPAVTNVDISVDITLDAAGNNGIVFRHQGVALGQWFTFRIKTGVASGNVLWERYIVGDVADGGFLTDIATPGVGSTYTLRVTVDGTTATFYVTGVNVGTTPVPTSFQHAGLCANTNGARFENFSIVTFP